MNIDLYELKYRDFSFLKKNETDVRIYENTTRLVKNYFKEFKQTESKKMKEISFSDVICNIMPEFNKNTGSLSYRHEYIFKDNDIEGDPNEQIQRFRNFNINTLPLIKVAKYLNIQVEKSSTIDSLGEYKRLQKKIILASDYPVTFVHELAHAIDHILENYYFNYYDLENNTVFNELAAERAELLINHENFVELANELFYNDDDFQELVAELSSVILCKKYKILINESASKRYFDRFSSSDIDENKLIARVSLIIKFVNKCLENIENNSA